MTQHSTVVFATLPTRKPTQFFWEPTARERAEMARVMGLLDLRKVRAEIILSPEGKRDWRLKSRWGASVVQPCVVTLAPVTTRLEQTETRLFTENLPEIKLSEAEAPEDDTLEPLDETLDLVAVLGEMIALALPPYPRAPGAELEATVFGPPDVAPMTDEDAKPFAGLAAFRDKLADGHGQDD